MQFTPLVTKGEIAAAASRIRVRLLQNTTPYRRILGFPSGEISAVIHWRPTEGMWSYMHRNAMSRVHSCCYGVADPKDKLKLDLMAEINIPISGFNRRVAGAFIRDTSGTIYLAHSGKIGGGKANVGKSSFLSYLVAADTAEVEWPDGKTTELIVVGSISDFHFPQQVADYLREVNDFKQTSRTAASYQAKHRTMHRYAAEFEGIRKGYRMNKQVESRCDHGLIVRSLKRELTKHGQAAFNDRHQDLYIIGRNQSISTLFEVKTSCDLTNIYTGVGQLMYNSTVVEQGRPRLVLVLPELGSGVIKATIETIGINVLSYGWRQERPVFVGLEKFV